MVTILTKEQCDQIRALRKEQDALGLEGWMSEGYDGNSNIIFNNDINASFIADYDGNIIMVSNEDNPSFYVDSTLRKYAELEGKISKICWIW